jgi:hypothetical protein
MRRFAVFLLAAIALRAADEKKIKPELPDDVRRVVELARAAAPEFFASTVVQLVERGQIPRLESRIDLLEEAFAVTQEAKEPYGLIAIPATPQDTRARHRGKSSELKLDALSLESRILREMIRLDRDKARAMFDEISHPLLDPRPCEDPLVADASAYYEMAAAIAQSTFTEPQKEKNAHVQFLEAVLDGAKSPGELLPFLETTRAVSLSPEQHELLMGAVASKMVSIGADYRPFAMTYEALKSIIDGLSAADREALQPAFRRYIVAQASAARCGPDFGPQIYTGEEEIRPSKIEGGIKADIYFQSGDSKQIADELVKLRNSPHGDDWASRFDDLLRDFSAWSPEGENVDAFHQRATILRALLQMAPSADDQERLMQMSAEFLGSASPEQDHPAEWLYQVELISSALGKTESDALRGLFHKSGNPGLVLYAGWGPVF